MNSNEIQLRTILFTVILAFLGSIIFGLIGVWLVVVGDKGESEISFLGMVVKTGSIGVGSLAVGTISFLYTVKQLFHFLNEKARLQAESKAELDKAIDRLRDQINDKRRQLESIKAKAGEEIKSFGPKAKQSAVLSEIDSSSNECAKQLENLETQTRQYLRQGSRDEYDSITSQMTVTYLSALEKINSLVKTHVDDYTAWAAFYAGYQLGVPAFATTLLAIGWGVWSHLTREGRSNSNADGSRPSPPST